MASSLGSGPAGRPTGIVGINITPMVDVVLVLLVIMMVSATYIVQQSLKVEVPKTKSSDGTATSPAVVTITKEGGLSFAGAPVNEDELRARLQAAETADPEVSLVVTADEQALHGRVMHVIDVAKDVGIAKFAINVERIN